MTRVDEPPPVSLKNFFNSTTALESLERKPEHCYPYRPLEHDAFPGHLILRDLADAPRIIHGVWRLEVQEFLSFRERPITLIPSDPDLPMEKVCTRTQKTDKAEIYPRDFTRDAPRGGRVVHIPWDVDRTFLDHEIMALESSQFTGPP